MIDSETTILYVARCDACGIRHQSLSAGFESAVRAIHLALDCGWTFGESSSAIYCPTCTVGLGGPEPS